MAAPIKVDELLVSFWLGSDEVYEDVLNLIEKYRLQRQQQLQLQSVAAPAPTGSSPKSKTKMQANAQAQAHDAHESTFADGKAAYDDPELSPRGVVIPPFYPLRTATGTKIQRRRQLPRQSETWDRLPDAALNLHLPLNLPLPVLPPQKPQSIDLPDDEQQEDQQGAPTTASATASATALCVKDQVNNLVPELNLQMQLQQLHMQPQSQNLQVTFSLESFIRITKEICNFPSFFNGPLYQRIVDIFNISNNQTQKDVTLTMLEWFWKTEMEPYDPPERFFRLVKQPNNDCILRDDFLPFIKALLNDHPVSYDGYIHGDTNTNTLILILTLMRYVT